MKKVSLCVAMVSFLWVCGVTSPALCCDLVCPSEGIAEVEPNGGCYDANPSFNSISCGTTVCGQGSYIGSIRDMDFFTFTLESDKIVTLTASAEFNWIMGITIPNSSDPCDNSGQLDYLVTGSACETKSVQAMLAGPGPGVYIVYFAHREFGEVLEGDYWIEMTCEDPPPCIPDFSVTAPGTWDGTTVGAGNDCLIRSGADHVYEVEIPYDGRWTFSLCDSDSSWETYMYLGSSCCGGDIALGNQKCDGGYGEHAYIADLDLTAGTYYLDIEPYFSVNAGPYTLDITYEPPCIVEYPSGSITEVEPNGGCNEVMPVFDAITCGQTVSGTAWFDGDWRDTDWYRFTLESNQYVTLTGTAEFAWIMAFIIPNPLDECNHNGLEYYVFGERCDTLSTTVGLAAGTYYAFFAPQFTFGSPFSDRNYWMSMTCEHMPSPEFVVNPTAIAGRALEGDEASALLTVSNSGDASLSASVSVNILPPAILIGLSISEDDGRISLKSDKKSASHAQGVSASDRNEMSGYSRDGNRALFDEMHSGTLFTIPIDPGGDNIEDAIPVTRIPYHATGSTYGFTDDYDEACVYSSSSPDVVYSYVATMDTVLDISLCQGTIFDSKLYVYENEVTPGAPVACDDNSCDGFLSAISLEYNSPLFVTAGNTYYIVVDGSNDQYGDYTLVVRYADPVPGCPAEGTLWSAAPTLPAMSYSFWTSDTEPAPNGFRVFENFSGAFGAIEELHWWGLDIYFDEARGDFVECDAVSETFEIAFYLAASDGIPATIVRADTVTVTPVATGLVYGEGEQKEYRATIDPPMVMAQGWVSIQGLTSGDNCWFMWQNSREITDGSSLTFDGTSYSQTKEDMSLCIIGTYEEPWLSVDVTSINIPPGGSVPVNVTMDAAGVADGIYNGAVVFKTNEMAYPIHAVPVSFEVLGIDECDCRPGYADGDDMFNLYDMSYLIEYIFQDGVAPVPYAVCSGDVNCDCVVNIIDIDYLIKYLFQQGSTPCGCLKWEGNCGVLNMK